MPLAPANQSQLIRSSQKDEYYQTFLRNNANEAFQTLAGSKRWLDWRREIELLSDLAYYGLTTFAGYQTLGEEYVNIIQVDPTETRIPSRTRRGLFVLCHSFFPYLLDKVLVGLENELGREPEGGGGGARQRQAASSPWSLESWLRGRARRAVALLSEPRRRACLPAVFALRQGLTLLRRLHVALFYISGSFYHLSKRAAGISYVAACDGAQRQGRDHPDQLPAPGGRVPPPAPRHGGSAAQRLQAEAARPAGVEAPPKPQPSAHTGLGPQGPRLHALPGGEETPHLHPLWTPVLLGVHHRVVQHQG
ncbi:peroxisome biogenesis factor 10 isoform X2 [Etheostoma spectabile]|uniref:peroxisome biogenesis factor 10 isoform X2 n=1 Tax=Etheostoma spectabile TaxID=54343 RepID=UPI0013AF81C5|nr:peroxisome biogenesis factor 10 isoform X2 [Etheostoma spectabile]